MMVDSALEVQMGSGRKVGGGRAVTVLTCDDVVVITVGEAVVCQHSLARCVMFGNRGGIIELFFSLCSLI